MYKKILVAIDGSANALYSLDQAVGLANGFGKDVEMTVFHVTHIDISEYTVQLGIDRLRREEGEAVLAAAQPYLDKAKFRHESVVIPGDPAQEIYERAKAGGYDLIVMGNRGRSLVTELLLGSVSHKVLQQAHCPVLIVRR